MHGCTNVQYICCILIHECIAVCMCVSWLHFADWFMDVPGGGAWEQQSFRVLFSSTTEATNVIFFFFLTTSSFTCLTLPWTPPVSPACIIHLHLSFCLHLTSLGTVNQQRILLLCWSLLWPFMVCTQHLPLSWTSNIQNKSCLSFKCFAGHLSVVLIF